MDGAQYEFDPVRCDDLVVAGAGPGGLYSAWRMIEAGIGSLRIAFRKRGGSRVIMAGIFFGPGEFGRSIKETIKSLPARIWASCSLKRMATVEKDFAHFSRNVYATPADRPPKSRGYTLLQDEIPCDDGTTVPLNNERWAVYRAPNGLDHVLVFRGTAGWEDIVHDVELTAEFGKHRYTMEAAVWSMRVMLFLVEKHITISCNDDKRLKFHVAGHSLGGAVAMGIMLLLHDIPLVNEVLQREQKNHGLIDFSRIFKDEIADPWHTAITRRDNELLYELCGSHIFNPGAFPRLTPNDNSDSFNTVLKPSTTMTNCRVGDSSSIDTLVTTHHILGDVLSCSFRLGREKNYLTWRFWQPHSMANFL